MAVWTGCARPCLSATVSAACSSLPAPPGPVHNSGWDSSLSPLVGLPCPLLAPSTTTQSWSGKIPPHCPHVSKLSNPGSVQHTDLSMCLSTGQAALDSEILALSMARQVPGT